MVRSVLTILCALIGGAALVVSAFFEWFGGREGQTFPISVLWEGVGKDTASMMGSLFVPLVLAAGLAVVGAFARKRLLVTVGALIGLATVLLFYLQVDKFDTLTKGWTNAASGAVLLLVAVVLVPRR